MTDHAVTFNTPPDDLEPVYRLLASVWRDRPEVSEEDRMAFETAVVELVTNVMRHAGQGSGVSCRLAVSFDENGQARAELTDTGQPGEVVLTGREMPDLSAESGRGIPLVRLLVDDLTFDASTDRNTWRIRKSLSVRGSDED